MWGATLLREQQEILFEFPGNYLEFRFRGSHDIATNSRGSVDVSIDLDAVSSKSASPACPRCVPASGQSSPGMIHAMSSATSASRPSLSPRPIAAKKSFTVWTFFSVLIVFLHFVWIG